MEEQGEQDHADLTPQQASKELNNIQLAKISGHLARYHFEKMRVRSMHIATGLPLTQDIVEFENYQFWQQNLWSPEFKLQHGTALDNIVQTNAKRIGELIEEAKNAPETARNILQQAQVLKKQIDDAGDLLEKLNG